MTKRIIGPCGEPGPTNSLRKFYRLFAGPSNWRVWWDASAALWHCQKWTGGGILSAPKLDVSQTRFVTEGKFLRFKDCDCWANGARYDASVNATVPSIRLRNRPVQIVGVAPVTARSAAKVGR